MSRITNDVVAEVLARAQGYCEACGAPFRDYALHHRHPRRMGSSRLPWIDTAVNLMVVHGGITGGCHNLGEFSIHARPARSYRLGHLVRYGVDPATVPVIIARDLRVLRA